MMPDTSTYYGQPSFVPPQFRLQGLFGQLHGQHAQPFGFPGQHPQPFGGFPPQGLLGQLQGQFGHQPIWPSFGFALQNPLALLSSLYGQHPIWPSFGGGLGPFAPISPYQQLGQQGGTFQGGWPGQQQGGFPPQFGSPLGFPQQFGSPLGGFAQQLGALGQPYLMNALGRGIGMPQLAYSGC